MSSYEPILGPHPIHLDDDDDEGNAPMVKAPVVDSAKDRLNPEVEYEVLDLAGDHNHGASDGPWVLVPARVGGSPFLAIAAHSGARRPGSRLARRRSEARVRR